MKKLVRGILDFKRHIRPGYVKTFSKLALGQHPDALMIACSDSRVVPNLFASTDPGDIFSHRNVGNIVPPFDKNGSSLREESEAASIDFAVGVLNVKDIIVCGHSKCGAMQTLMNANYRNDVPHIKSWLRHAHGSLEKLDTNKSEKSIWDLTDQLSQWNVHQQIENISSYPVVQRAIEERGLRLHAWWFDIARADVYIYNRLEKKFKVIDEAEAEELLSTLEYSDKQESRVVPEKQI